MPGLEIENESVATTTVTQGAAMEITVTRQDLLKELTAIQSVVERKTTIPILSNFLVEVPTEQRAENSTSPPPTSTRPFAPPPTPRSKRSAPAPFPRASSTTTSSSFPMAKSPSSSSITTGSRSAPAVPTPGWSASAAPTTRRSRAALRLERQDSRSHPQDLIARTIFSISNEESRYTLNGAL